MDMRLNTAILKNLINLLIFGIPGIACFGGGVELGNGSGSLMIYMKYNKNGHIVMYNNLQSILSRHQRRYHYVPISILSNYEKL